MPAVMEPAKRNFLQSEEVFAPWHSPVSDGTAYSFPKKHKRVSMYGAFNGKVGMTSDFDAPIGDFVEYM